MDDDNPEEREVLSAKISRRAAEGFREFCASEGISVTALLEVAGREFTAPVSPSMQETRERMVKAAREIDRERRSRKNNHHS